MSSRNIGLDILRIFAIVCISNIHFLAYTGLFEMTRSDMTGYNYLFVSILKSLDYCFVDLFVLITGFFMSMKKAPKKKLVDLWFELVLVGLFTLAVTTAIFPSSFSLQSLIRTLLPITTYEYWYIVTYAILFLMIPYINNYLDGISQKTHLRILLFWGIVSLLLDLNPIIKLEHIQGNYMGIVWFVYIYAIGSYIKRYGFPLKDKVLYLMGAVSFLLMFAIYYYNINLPYSMKLNSEVSMGPLMVSLALFRLFSNVKAQTPRFDKLVMILAESSLAVYLVQEQFQFRGVFWDKMAVSSYVETPYLILNWLLCISILWCMAICGHFLYKFLYKQCLQQAVYSIISNVKNYSVTRLKN